MALHPIARVLLAGQEEPVVPTLERVVQEREQMRAAALANHQRIGLDAVIDVDARGVQCRLYRPRAGAPVALYVHGGGWILHDIETHDAFCRHLAHVTGWALLSVDYRRAPEHPYPAPLDDVETAARWLRDKGRELRVDADYLPAIGDSAGGNLVAGLSVRDAALLDHLVLFYPVVDRLGELVEEAGWGPHFEETMEWYWQAYAPGDLAMLPDVSVARADLSGFPPTVVVTSEHDVLREQGESFAAALADAEVPVVAFRALGMLHAFWTQPELFEASRALVVMIGAHLDAARAGRPKP